MASELEFVNYKQFVEDLPRRDFRKFGDKSVVCNSVDGPGKETLVTGNDIEIQHPDDSSFVKIVHGSDLIRGRQGETGYVDHLSQATSRDFIPVYVGDEISFSYKSPNTGVSVYVVFYSSSKEETSRTSWLGPTNNGNGPENIKIDFDGFVKFGFYKDSTTITTQEQLDYFDSTVLILRFGKAKNFEESFHEKVISVSGVKERELVLGAGYLEQGYWIISPSLSKGGNKNRVRNVRGTDVSIGDSFAVTDVALELVGVLVPQSGLSDAIVYDGVAGFYCPVAGKVYLAVRWKGAASTALAVSDVAGKIVVYRNIVNYDNVFVSDSRGLKFGVWGGNHNQRIINYRPLHANKGDILIVNHKKLMVNVMEVNPLTDELIVQTPNYITTTYAPPGSYDCGYYVVRNNDVILKLTIAPVYNYTLTSNIADYADCVLLIRPNSRDYDIRWFDRCTPKSSRKGRVINVDVPYMQDGAFVGNYLWVSNYPYTPGGDSIKVIDVDSQTLVKEISHDFGHHGVADWCAENDTMLNVIPTDNKIYLLPNASSVTTSISKSECIQINLYDLFGILGSGNCGCFGENKQTIYIAKGYEEETTTTINEIYKIWLAVDSNGDYTGEASLVGTYKLDSFDGTVNGIYADYANGELHATQSVKYDGYIYLAYGTSGHNFLVVDLDDKTMTWKIVGRIAYEYFTPDHVKKYLEPEFVALRNGKIVCGSRHIDTNDHSNDISSIVEFEKW